MKFACPQRASPRNTLLKASLVSVLIATGGGIAAAQPTTIPSATTTTTTIIATAAPTTTTEPVAPQSTAPVTTTTTTGPPVASTGPAPSADAEKRSIAPSSTEPSVSEALIPSAEQDPEAKATGPKKPVSKWSRTENPNSKVTPGKMRSDREEIPEGFTKADADKAETMEAKAAITAFAAAGCQVYWPAPYEVCGAIRDKYNSLGGPGGFLSWPASNELVNPDGYGRRSVFVGGLLYWSPTSGAHPMNALFLAKWAGMGYEAGLMGYPTGDEIVNPDGFGRRQSFNRGGWFYYSQVTGVQQIGGAIYQEWGQRGFESGSMGYPITDEIDVPSFLAPMGTRMNIFQRGVLAWNPASASAKFGSWLTGTGEGSGIVIPNGGTPDQVTPFDLPTDPGEAEIRPGLPIEAPCPGDSATANVGTKFAAYKCTVAYPDVFGDVVPLRTGRVGQVNWDGAQTAGGFGELHAWDKHKIDADAIGKIINVATPQTVGKRIERFATFKDQDGNTYVRAFVSTSNGVSLDAADHEKIGVITAFCKTGPEAGMGLCPPFVNETLGSAIGPS